MVIIGDGKISGFTKGPWVANRSIPLDGVDGWRICAVPYSAQYQTNIGWINGGDKNQPNASLFAAAPDMYEALTLFVKYHGSQDFSGVEHMLDYDNAITATRDAISKADGKS